VYSASSTNVEFQKNGDVDTRQEEVEPYSNWEYVYIAMAPASNAKLPVPIQRLLMSSAKENRDDHSTVSISTLAPALPGDIQKYMKEMLGSLKAQTVPADEVVIVVSDVQTKANASHPEASASDWCAATQRNLVDLLYNNTSSEGSTSSSNTSSNTSKLKLVCVGERMTAGRARNLAVRFASGDVLSFIDADDQELPIRNQITQNMFGLCNPNGNELKMLLHSFTNGHRRRKQHYYWKYTNETFPYGFLPSETECADKDDPHIKVMRASDFNGILKDTVQRLWLTPTVHHGHSIVHRSVFDRVHFSSFGRGGEDALFVRDVLYSYGQRNDAVVFLDRPLTTYYQVQGRGKQNHT
jgi:glycosyltransferase involved in cell wall biosynthesis